MQAVQRLPDEGAKACIYIRQSVERDDSVSAELQEIACREHASRHGYEVVDVVVDIGRTGRTTNKRQINSVVDRIAADDYQVIIVWKWSRISRNRRDWAVLSDRVDMAGGRIESATEPIDASTASGKLSRGMMTEIAAFVSDQIGEQWAETHRRRFNLGLLPSGPIPFGWEKNDGGIRPHPTNAEVVRTLYRMFFNGAGFDRMCRWLNDNGISSPRGGTWRHASLKGTLDSPVHAGLVIYENELREGQHDGIISVDDWERYKAMRADRHIPRRDRNGSKYLLSGLILCHCGAKRAGHTAHPNSQRRTPNLSYKCSAPVSHARMSITTHKVDRPFGEWMKTLPQWAEQPAQINAKVDATLVRREQDQIKKHLGKLRRHLLDEVLTPEEYAATRDELNLELENLDRQLSEVKKQTLLTPSAFITGKEDLLLSWDVLDFEDKQQLARALVQTIAIHPDYTATIRPAWGNDVVINVS